MFGTSRIRIRHIDNYLGLIAIIGYGHVTLMFKIELN